MAIRSQLIQHALFRLFSQLDQFGQILPMFYRSAEVREETLQQTEGTLHQGKSQILMRAGAVQVNQSRLRCQVEFGPQTIQQCLGQGCKRGRS